MKKKGTRRCLHQYIKSLITPSLHLCFFKITMQAIGCQDVVDALCRDGRSETSRDPATERRCVTPSHLVSAPAPSSSPPPHKGAGAETRWDGVTQRLSVASRQTAKTSRPRKTPVITWVCPGFRTTQPKACAAFVAAAGP